jgi:glycosyltransferase involved in cell wall biosynthesis
MTDISVVIPTYNRIDTLEYVIPSLLASELDLHRYEVIVADSMSTDGTAKYMSEITTSFPNVRHLPGPYTGRASARNAGISAARGVLVLFTDADIIASPELLRHHLERHTASASAGRRRVAVIGKEVQVRSLEEYEYLRDHPKSRRSLHPEARKRIDWLYFLTGNASVRREELEKLGGFDESFTGYGHEDLELGYRLKQAGVELLYEPRAVNFHWHPVPYEEQRGRMELAGRSTVRFAQKHRSKEIPLKLGMTPLSLVLHSLIERIPGLVKYLSRSGERNKFARDIIYQFHYVNGIKQARAELKEAKRRETTKGAE